MAVAVAARLDLDVAEVDAARCELAANPAAVVVVADGAQVGRAQAEAGAGGERRRDLPSARPRLLLDPDLGARTAGLREHRQPADLVDTARPDADDVERSSRLRLPGSGRSAPLACGAAARVPAVVAPGELAAARFDDDHFGAALAVRSP